MLTLLTFPGTQSSFSFSPFCVKAALLLSYAKADWQRQDMTDPQKMPHQKLPVLKTEKRLVPDSDGIRTWLEASGADFDPGLTPIEKARSRVLIRMAEEHLYFQVVQDRWANDDVWPVLRDTFFNTVPAILRKPIANSVRKSVLRGLDFQGTSRFSSAERQDRMERDLRALTELVWDSPFLMGEKITSADFSVAPVLQAMKETPSQTWLKHRVANDPIISGYLGRVLEEVPLTSRDN